MQIILLVILQWALMAAVPMAWAGALLWTVYLFRDKSKNVQRLLALLVFLTTVYVQISLAKWVLVLYFDDSPASSASAAEAAQCRAAHLSQCFAAHSPT